MPAPSKFTQARDKNGHIRRVPRAWLEEDSPFYGQYTLTPSARQVEERSEAPDESWTVAQLRQYVDGQGIDVPASAPKSGYLSAITERASGASDSQEG